MINPEKTKNGVDIACKSNLAKLLATEDLHIRHDPRLSQSTFDPKKRVLTLPMWDGLTEDIYDLFVGSSVGHALHSPSNPAIINQAISYVDPKNPAVAQTYIDIVDERRVEKEMTDKYPGLEAPFLRAYEQLYNMDAYGIKKIPDLMSLSLIDRINLHYKLGVGGVKEIPFTPAEKKIIDEIDKATSYEDAVRIAKKVYTLDDPDIVPPEQGESDGDGDGEGEGKGQGQGEGQGKDKSQKPSQGNGQGQGQGQGKPQNPGKNQGKPQPGAAPPQHGTPGGGGKTEISGAGTAKAQKPQQGSVTRGNLAAAMSSKVSKNSATPFYVSIPDVDHTKNVVPHKLVWSHFDTWASKNKVELPDVNQLYAKLMTRHRGRINQMVNQFNMKKAADTHARTSERDSGALNMSRIYAYKFDDNIFLQQAVVKDGKNHGFFMVIDWSGSMSNCIAQVTEQVIVMSMFCRQVGIPFEVYNFTNCSVRGEYKMAEFDTTKFKDDDAMLNYFVLMNLLSNKMTTEQFKKGCVRLMQLACSMSSSDKSFQLTMPGSRYPVTDPCFSLGGTPLNEAVAACFDLVPKFQKANNIQIVNTIILTDGDGDTSMFHGTKKGRGNNGGMTILVDNKTKEHRTCQNVYECPTVLLEMLKSRTKCNTVGFYLSSGAGQGIIGSKCQGESKEKIAKLAQDYANMGFVSLRSAGYDEWFVVDTSKLNTSGVSMETAMAKASSSTVSTAFNQTLVTNKNARMFVNAFIDLISRNRSVAESKLIRAGKKK